MTKPLIAVLDYGIGNLRSAQKGLQKVGADARLTADPDLIESAAAVVLPGVGNFGRCMEALHATGLAEPAVAAAASGRPFLGICVGMQLMYESSEESPGVPGLGILSGSINLLPDTVKRPQMQWNTVAVAEGGRLLAGFETGSWFYFVHSYAAAPGPETAATCSYGIDVAAAIEVDNVMATQFHPEKSSRNGLALLQNFVTLI